MKAKELFEGSRIPFWFSKEHDTWINCMDGNIRVRWLGDRWIVLATRERTIYTEDRDLRHVLSELSVKLGGLKR